MLEGVQAAGVSVDGVHATFCCFSQRCQPATSMTHFRWSGWYVPPATATANERSARLCVNHDRETTGVTRPQNLCSDGCANTNCRNSDFVRLPQAFIGLHEAGDVSCPWHDMKTEWRWLCIGLKWRADDTAELLW